MENNQLKQIIPQPNVPFNMGDDKAYDKAFVSAFAGSCLCVPVIGSRLHKTSEERILQIRLKTT